MSNLQLAKDIATGSDKYRGLFESGLYEQLFGSLEIGAVDMRSAYHGKLVTESCPKKPDGSFKATPFHMWVKRIIENLKLVDGKDFHAHKNVRVTRTDSMEYTFPLRLAKKVLARECEIVLDYLTDCEEALQEVAKKITERANLSETERAYTEFGTIANVMAGVVALGWGRGYVQKQIFLTAESIDTRYGTKIANELPVPTAQIGQVETLDPTQGNHLLTRAGGSFQMSTKKIAKIFYVSVTSFNRAMVALGYQMKAAPKGTSKYLAAPGYEKLATGRELESGPAKGKNGIEVWHWDLLTETDRARIRDYVSNNFPREVMAQKQEEAQEILNASVNQGELK